MISGNRSLLRPPIVSGITVVVALLAFAPAALAATHAPDPGPGSGAGTFAPDPYPGVSVQPQRMAPTIVVVRPAPVVQTRTVVVQAPAPKAKPRPVLKAKPQHVTPVRTAPTATSTVHRKLPSVATRALANVGSPSHQPSRLVALAVAATVLLSASLLVAALREIKREVVE